MALDGTYAAGFEEERTQHYRSSSSETTSEPASSADPPFSHLDRTELQATLRLQVLQGQKFLFASSPASTAAPEAVR